MRPDPSSCTVEFKSTLRNNFISVRTIPDLRQHFRFCAKIILKLFRTAIGLYVIHIHLVQSI